MNRLMALGAALVGSACGTAFGGISGYTGNVVGLDGADQPVGMLDVLPGETFSGQVMLDSLTGAESDFALFRLVFSEPGLEYAPGWYDWSPPFTTGGIDDFSSPASDASGVIDVDTHTDVFSPGDIDVVFENVSDSFGEVFATGAILDFTFTVPASFEPTSLTISFAPDTFSDGIDPVDATPGVSLLINVVPAPAAGLTLGFGGVLLVRRRR